MVYSLDHSEALYYSWPLPAPIMEELGHRLYAVAQYMHQTLAMSQLPQEMLAIMNEALRSPNKLLASPTASDHPLQEADSNLWSLPVILVHAAITHTDSVNMPQDSWASIIPVAASVEFLGLSLDLFDDAQDNDSAFLELYGSPIVIDVALALLELAHNTLLDDRLPAVVRMSLQQLWSQDILRSIGGQFLDLDYEHRSKVSFDEAIEMTELKSGSLVGIVYRIGAYVGAMTSPLADHALRLSEQFAAFGRQLGVVNQLGGDRLDAERTSLKSDRARGKKTLPLVIEATKAAQALETEARQAYIDRIMDTTLLLFSKRARTQLEQLAATYTVSMKWIGWVVDLQQEVSQ